MLQFDHIPIYSINLQAAVDEFLELVSVPETNSQRPICISATSAHGLVEAHKDPSFKALLAKFYWNLPDGIPLVWWGRLKGYAQMDRCYGPDFFEAIMKATSLLKVAHFFCGGKQGVAKELQQTVNQKFGNNNIVGVFCPPFNPMQERDWASLVTLINQTNAQLIWIGISTPKQERFAMELAKRVQVKFIITVGAAFDFHTGRLTQAPRWMQRSGLEWFYRVCKEPRRLWKRYFEIVPKFAMLAVVDLIKYYLLKRN